MDDEKKIYLAQMRAEKKAWEYIFIRQRSYRFAPLFSSIIDSKIQVSEWKIFGVNGRIV